MPGRGMVFVSFAVFDKDIFHFSEARLRSWAVVSRVSREVFIQSNYRAWN
jgi:hypothetical protein